MGPEVDGEGIRSPMGVSDLVGDLPALITGVSDRVDSGDFDFLLLGIYICHARKLTSPIPIQAKLNPLKTIPFEVRTSPQSSLSTVSH